MSYLAIDHSQVHTDDGLYTGEEVVCACPLSTDDDDTFFASGGIEQVGVEMELDEALISTDVHSDISSDDGELHRSKLSEQNEADMNEADMALSADEDDAKVYSTAIVAVGGPGTINLQSMLQSDTNNTKGSSVTSRLRVLRRQLLTRATSKLKLAVTSNRSKKKRRPPSYTAASSLASPRAQQTLKMACDNATVVTHDTHAPSHDELTVVGSSRPTSQHGARDCHGTSDDRPVGGATAEDAIGGKISRTGRATGTNGEKAKGEGSTMESRTNSYASHVDRNLNNTPSSMTASTCDFDPHPNHHAIFESYLVSNPWEAAKRGDYATLSYIANHHADDNIWVQEDEFGHVPLFYACTYYCTSGRDGSNSSSNSNSSGGDGGGGSFGKYGLESIKFLIRTWPDHVELPSALLEKCSDSTIEKGDDTFSHSSGSGKIHKDVLDVLARSTKTRGLLLHRPAPSVGHQYLPKINEQMIEGMGDVVPFSFLEDLGDDGYVEDY